MDVFLKTIKHKKLLRSDLITLFVSLSLAIIYSYSFWCDFLIAYPINKGFFSFTLAVILLIASLNYVVLILFNFKLLLKPLFSIWLIIAAICAYAMDTYGYVISSNTYTNLVRTNSSELIDLLNFNFVLYVLLLVVIPLLFLLPRKIIYVSLKQQFACLLITLLLIVINLAAFNKYYLTFFRHPEQMRYFLNPIRQVYFFADYVKEYLVGEQDKTIKILEAKPFKIANSGKARLIVLVLGESDRAMNQSLNGYKRNTNPKLTAREDVYSFQNVSACGTETFVSIPCMFSAYKREDFTSAKGRYTENVLDILNRSNVQILWRDNDDGCVNVCDRIAVDDFNYASIAPYCKNFDCYDEVLLHNLQEYIDQKLGDKLIVLHRFGNHGISYHERYPKNFEVFKPCCESHGFSACTNEELINAYDNIILYGDYFLDQLITQLEYNNEDYQTAMIYISDHGESLGENGIYMHGLPYFWAPKEQIHIPFFFWASKDFLIDRAALKAKLHQELSHDNLFHTLLGLFGVQTRLYDPNLDVFYSTYRNT